MRKKVNQIASSDYLRTTCIWVSLVLLITLISLGIRIRNLTTHGLSYDELFTASTILNHDGWFARSNEPLFVDGLLNISLSDSWLTNISHDQMPPLFSMLLVPWTALFGFSDFALRSLPMILGALTPIVFTLGLRKLIGKKYALFGGFLLAISAPLITYSQFVRGYSLVVLIVTLSIIHYSKIVDSSFHENKNPTKLRNWFVIDALLLTLSGLTNYSGVLISGTFSIFAILRFLITKKKKRYIAFYSFPASMILGWMIFNSKVIKAVTTGQLSWGENTASFIWEFMLASTAEFLVPIKYGMFFTAVLLILILSVQSSSVKNICYQVRKTPDDFSFLTINVAAVTAIIIVLIYNIFLAVILNQWLPRYFLVIIPLVYLLIATSMKNLVIEKWKENTFLVFICLISSLSVLQPPSPVVDTQYREGAQKIVRASGINPLIIFAWKPNAREYDHYLKLGYGGKGYRLLDVSSEAETVQVCQDLGRTERELHFFIDNNYLKLQDSLLENCEIFFNQVNVEYFRGITITTLRKS
jgi:uncharacterized membrane protein